MKNILDRSESYLTIFTESFVFDSNLPKWSQIVEENKETLLEMPTFSRSLAVPKESKQEIAIKNLLKMNSKDFNIYVGKNVINKAAKAYYNMFEDNGLEPIALNNKKEGVLRRLWRKFRNKSKEEEVYEIDIVKFFDQVKLTTKESAKDYIDRIKPYIVALKKANDMGQTALVDELTAQIFNNKYESILKAEGFYYKITEEQLVNFVKKTEKGVRLDYIKNFTRNIPEEVLAKKIKADSLLVFDNYCVLYYDPNVKSYKLTKEEKDEIRRKKSDPILFGMINDSHNLYYIADWIDDYCDLTLEEFIKVSGYDKEELTIDEKIKL